MSDAASIADDDRARVLAAVVDQSSDAMWAVDRESRLVAYNARFACYFEKRLGARRPALGRQAAPSAERGFWNALYARAFAGDTFTAPYVVSIGGEERHYELRVTPIRNAAGEPPIFAGVTGRDVTADMRDRRVHDRERGVLDLVASDADIHRVLTEAAHVIETAAPEMSAVFVGLKGGALRVVAHGALPGRWIEKLEEVLASALTGAPGWWAAPALQGATVIVADVSTDPQIAAQRPLLLAEGLRACWATPVLREEDEVLLFVGYYRDARTPTRAHVALIERASGLARLATRGATRRESPRTDRPAEVTSLVTGFAHEVRNPLFGLAATLDALEQRLTDDGEHAPYVRVMRSQTERIAVLTRQLLEYGSPYTLNLAPTSITSLLRSAARTCRVYAERAGVTLEVEAEPGLPPVHVDPVRITQVMVDLVDNAIHFSPSGAKIAIVAERRQHEGMSHVACEVRDAGAGFDELELLTVFEPFFSKRKGRAGLGLAIARRVVREHGGMIEAANREGGGGVVRVLLRAGARG